MPYVTLIEDYLLLGSLSVRNDVRNQFNDIVSIFSAENSRNKIRSFQLRQVTCFPCK